MMWIAALRKLGNKIGQKFRKEEKCTYFRVKLLEVSKSYTSPTHNDKHLSIVNEATAQYLPASHGMDFISFLKDKFTMMQSIQRGITQRFFEAIRSRMPFTDQQWADFLNISPKSLQRYSTDASHVFKPIHSEKIIQLAQVMEEGRATFGSQERFYRWLDTPNVALGGGKPMDMLHNSYGQELVLAELNAINYGIFA